MAVRLTGEPVPADNLLDRWRDASLAGSWAWPGDWWTPATVAVAEAVATGRPARAAAAELGRERAGAGAGLEETLDDLDALYQCVAAGPPPDVVRAEATAWADGQQALTRAASTCEDPLTGLVSVAYLRTRLRELYREGSRAGAPIGRSHALLVVAVPRPAGWAQLTHGLRLGDALRAVFSGGETLCAVRPDLAVALVGRPALLPRRLGTLRGLLRERLSDAPVARLWVERLPRTASAALVLVEELARGR